MSSNTNLHEKIAFPEKAKLGEVRKLIKISKR
jgi:hypothetical protein